MKYVRLARSKRGLGKWYTLWLGDDHLLAVVSTGYSEEYSRYYLKDIQAVITRRSSWGMIMNLIFGALTAISLVAGLADFFHNRGQMTPTIVTACIFVGIFLPLMIWNLFRGPTCRCHIRSSVGIKELPALDRVRSAKKVIARLRPLTGQLQGVLSREEIAALTRAALEAPSAATHLTSDAKLNPSEPPKEESAVSPYRSTLLRTAFLLLVAEAGISIIQLFHNSKPLTTISGFIILGFFLIFISAQIKLRDNRVEPMARKLSWGGLATLVTASVIETVFMMIFGFDQIKSGKMTSQEIKDLYMAINPLEHLPLACFRLLYILAIAGIGIAGLISLGKGQGAATRGRP